MHRDWLAMEHYRLHSIEDWPESAVKTVRLEAIHSTLASLQRTAPASATAFECAVCGDHRRGNVVHFPNRVGHMLPKAA